MPWSDKCASRVSVRDRDRIAGAARTITGGIAIQEITLSPILASAISDAMGVSLRILAVSSPVGRCGVREPAATLSPDKLQRSLRERCLISLKCKFRIMSFSSLFRLVKLAVARPSRSL